MREELKIGECVIHREGDGWELLEPDAAQKHFRSFWRTVERAVITEVPSEWVPSEWEEESGTVWEDWVNEWVPLVTGINFNGVSVSRGVDNETWRVCDHRFRRYPEMLEEGFAQLKEAVQVAIRWSRTDRCLRPDPPHEVHTVLCLTAAK